MPISKGLIHPGMVIQLTSKLPSMTDRVKNMLMVVIDKTDEVMTVIPLLLRDHEYTGFKEFSIKVKGGMYRRIGSIRGAACEVDDYFG